MSQDNGAPEGADNSRELSHSDYNFASRSRRGSLGSSRFSGRPSLRSSVRDDAQTLDEFLRKQGVIRFMQEERERAARSKILREEHDAWVEFRANERSERLKYMTEQEIAELLQREADEALRDNRLAEANAKSAIDETARRRQGLADVRKKEEEAVVARRRSEAQTETALRDAKRDAAAREEAMREVEEVRRASVELRDREEELQRKCRGLEQELEEAKRAAAQGQGKQAASEKKVRDQLLDQKNANDDLRRQLEDSQRAARDAKSDLDAAKREAKQLQSSTKAKDSKISDLQQQLDRAAADKDAAGAAAAQKSRDAVAKAGNEAKQAKASLEQEQEARKAAEQKADDLQRQLDAAKKQQGKAPKVDEAALKAREDLARERQLRDDAQREAARLQAALAEETAARQAAEISSRQEPPQRGGGSDTEALLRRIAELEEELARLREQHEDDQRTIRRLNEELRQAQDRISREAAARARFEELASKAVAPSAGGAAAGDALSRMQHELDEARRALSDAQRDSEDSRQQYEREIEALKVYCARLKEQQQQSNGVPSSSKDSPNKLSAVKVHPGDASARGSARPSLGPASAEELQRLQLNINALRQQVADQQEKERRAALELKKAQRDAAAARKQAEVAQRDAERARSDAQKQAASVPRAREVPPVPYQSHSQQQHDSKVAELAKENADLKRRYDTLFKAHKDSDKARTDAEKEVSHQRERIQNLEREIETSVARAHAPAGQPVSPPEEKVVVVEKESRDGAAATQAIAELERQLQEEKAAREAAEEHLTEEKEKASRAEERAAAAESKANASVAKAKKAEERYANAQAASATAPKKEKASCGCC